MNVLLVILQRTHSSLSKTLIRIIKELEGNSDRIENIQNNR